MVAKPHWHGPGYVFVGQQGSRVWVAHAAKVYRCAAEQMKRVSREQENLVRLLPHELRICRQGLRERGDGNVVEVDGRALPPPEEKEVRQSPAAESGPTDQQGPAHAEVSANMEEEPATSLRKAGETPPEKP